MVPVVPIFFAMAVFLLLVENLGSSVRAGAPLMGRRDGAGSTP